MARGDLISYGNICSMLDRSVYRSHIAEGSSSTGTYVSYVISPSFWVSFYVGVWGIASIDGSMTVQQYTGDSSNPWVTRQSVSLSGRNNSSQKNNYAYYYHNYYTNQNTQGDDPRVHLFKISSGATWTQGIASWRTVSKNVYVGGVEHMSEDQFNSVCKFTETGELKPIRGLKPMIYKVGSGANSTDCEYLPSEQEIIEKYTSNIYRGTPISVESGTYKYCC